MTKEKMIVWDWNCCLLDDFHVSHTAMDRILLKFKGISLDKEVFRDKFDMPFSQMFLNLGFAEHELDEALYKYGYDIYGSTVKELMPSVKMKQGSDTVLDMAKSSNVKNIIVSNSKVEVITEKLKENKLDLHFDHVIGINHVKYNTSSKSDNFSSFASDCNLYEHELVFVGDTFEEIDMAKSFKGTSFAITGGNISEKRLRARNPDFIVNDFNEINTALTQIGFLKNDRFVA